MKEPASTWPDARVERLRTLAAQGKSASQIGLEIGATKNAVIGQCDRRNIVLKGEDLRTAKRISKGKPSWTAAPKIEVGVTPSPPRRFSWQEALDAPSERA